MNVWNYACHFVNDKVNGKKVERSKAHVNTIMSAPLLTVDKKCEALVNESKRLQLWQFECEEWEINLHFIISKFIKDNNLSLFDYMRG